MTASFVASVLSQHESTNTPSDGASGRRVDTNVLTWSFA
ncbi:hypothetical protein SAMN06295879_3534 [Agreia bicolorata]|uniref:Uncharacterized protein n=1 Tax=Agreia bicolorata TaxID=110935 RepID=A0A1T4YL57_9MICO|nr:hypothetical protein SAMN06295879_3534 [Agreia bicolorata]